MPPDTIAALPKAELHCHLLGVISPSLLKQLQEAGLPIMLDPAPLFRLPAITDKQSFQLWIDALKPYQQASWKIYMPILEYHLQNLIGQRVVYTEIMISPTMFPEDREAMIESFHAFRHQVDQLENGKLQVEFIMVMPRTLSDERILKNVQDYIALFQHGLIVGVAIVGLENGNSIRRFFTALKRCKDAGLGVEIHAGEHSGPEDVAEVLDLGFADRIGHGIGLFQSPALIKRATNEAVHFEFCLTSNLKSGSVSAIKAHPLTIASENGISFSISTDDPGFFSCSMNSEYELLATHFGFTNGDFNMLLHHSLNARFQERLKYCQAS